ncbi:MAG TPA: hypothetical protein VLB80_01565 [Candidatus Babeliales bacterium]|nr:hypothetical protein [Candidatus Babeliales bacterium]
MSHNEKVDKCRYDAIKLHYKLSKILKFIEHHAEEDAKEVNDQEFHKLLDNIEEHLEKFVSQLDQRICK